MTSEEIMAIIDRSNNPVVNELLGLLRQKDAVPQFSVDPSRGRGGAYSAVGNKIQLGPQGGNTGTVAHELTHALDHQMEKDYLDWQRYIWPPKGPAKLQFMDAYKKLLPQTTNVQPGVVNDITQGERNYRFSPKEMRAFGVGNMNLRGEGMFPVGGHLDGTMASEAAVLRDLYGKAINEPAAPFKSLLGFGQ